MDIQKYLSEDVRIFMRQTIDDAGGNEVFFIGRTDQNKRVDKIDVMARGTQVEVPAIIANCRPGEVVIHNHPSGHLDPSAADMNIAGIVGNEGVGFFITDNLVEELYVVVEPQVPEKPVSIDFENLKRFLDEDGPLSRKLSNFEKREPQLEMLQQVVEAFNHNRIAVIEAGTGTGKTMAYLLPAIAWSLANGKRVAISTNTINLQQQLTEKDIPLLQSIFPKKFRAELVKGRNNYVCLRKLHEVARQPSLLDLEGAEKEIEQLWQWAQKTRDGS
ncbi:MAG: DEAD/DEAH box helicase, partial [Calditrichaeota bacterium]